MQLRINSGPIHQIMYYVKMHNCKLYIQYLLWNSVQKFEGSEIFLKGNTF